MYNQLKIKAYKIIQSSSDYIAPVATVSISAGTFATITPSSMKNIFVGETVFVVDGGINNSGEAVTVTMVTSTTFTAYFERAHSGPVYIGILYLKASSAVEIMFNTIAPTININQTPYITDSIKDLPQTIFEKITYKDFFTAMADKGNGITRYTYGVDEKERFFFAHRTTISLMRTK
jgi:hypothetical protein